MLCPTTVVSHNPRSLRKESAITYILDHAHAASLPSSDVLAAEVQAILDTHKGLDIVVLDVRDKTPLMDFMVVATGTSSRHIDALAHYVEDAFKDKGYRDIIIDGRPVCDWVVIDLLDVVVHLFKPDVRGLYQLEKLWSFPSEG